MRAVDKLGAREIVCLFARHTLLTPRRLDVYSSTYLGLNLFPSSSLRHKITSAEKALSLSLSLSLSLCYGSKSCNLFPRPLQPHWLTVISFSIDNLSLAQICLNKFEAKLV